MWSLQDDIRGELKKISKFLAGEQVGGEELRAFINEVALPLLATLEGLIFKEENILFPMCMQNFTEAEWWEIYRQSGEIGFTLTEPDSGWQPALAGEDLSGGGAKQDGLFKLETGLLSLEQINLIFNHLPVDVTFVDKDDVVRYFSQGPERIFVRTPAVIGRKVQNCHPPESVHVVEKIVSDFKSGKLDKADFWLHYNGMYVYITYFALRDKAGNYAGTLEVTQNIKPILELQGEKRILQHE